MATYSVKRLVIVTGMSGSGKSSTLNLLEDQGLFAIDNIPVDLLPKLIDLLGSHEAAVTNGVVAVVDVRSDRFLQNFVSITDGLRDKVQDFSIVYLDASDDVLVRRFNLTKRRHPLGRSLSVLEGIRMERDLLKPVRERADILVDTSNLNMRDFRSQMLEKLGRSESELDVFISSFGFKHGIPHDSDYVLDVRFLPNPYYVESLKDCTGKDVQVLDYIEDHFDEFRYFIEQTSQFLSYIISRYSKVGKRQVHIAIGCTGGRHRSVAVVESLFKEFDRREISCLIRHRDIDKP